MGVVVDNIILPYVIMLSIPSTYTIFKDYVIIV